MNGYMEKVFKKKRNFFFEDTPFYCIA